MLRSSPISLPFFLVQITFLLCKWRWHWNPTILSNVRLLVLNSLAHTHRPLHWPLFRTPPPDTGHAASQRNSEWTRNLNISVVVWFFVEWITVRIVSFGVWFVGWLVCCWTWSLECCLFMLKIFVKLILNRLSKKLLGGLYNWHFGYVLWDVKDA
jgi:hypothetical protein